MAIQVDDITYILDEFNHKIIEWFCKNVSQMNVCTDA